MTIYRLLKGLHTQVEKNPPTRGSNITPIYVPGEKEGEQKIDGYRVTYGALIPKKVGNEIELFPQDGFTAADQFVESDIDLVARFGQEKFIKAHREDIEQVMNQENLGNTSSLSDGFENMTEAELRSLAKREGIDLKGAKDKASMIQIIRSAAVPA